MQTGALKEDSLKKKKANRDLVESIMLINPWLWSVSLRVQQEIDGSLWKQFNDGTTYKGVGRM